MTAYNDENTNKTPQKPKTVALWSDKPLVLGAFCSYPIPPNTPKTPVIGAVDFLVTCRTCLLAGQPHPKLNATGVYVSIGGRIFASTWYGLIGIAVGALIAWVVG